MYIIGLYILCPSGFFLPSRPPYAFAAALCSITASKFVSRHQQSLFQSVVVMLPSVAQVWKGLLGMKCSAPIGNGLFFKHEQ